MTSRVPVALIALAVAATIPSVGTADDAMVCATFLDATGDTRGPKPTLWHRIEDAPRVDLTSATIEVARDQRGRPTNAALVTVRVDDLDGPRPTGATGPTMFKASWTAQEGTVGYEATAMSDGGGGWTARVFRRPVDADPRAPRTEPAALAFRTGDAVAIVFHNAGLGSHVSGLRAQAFEFAAATDQTMAERSQFFHTSALDDYPLGVEVASDSLVGTHPVHLLAPCDLWTIGHTRRFTCTAAHDPRGDQHAAQTGEHRSLPGSDVRHVTVRGHGTTVMVDVVVQDLRPSGHRSYEVTLAWDADQPPTTVSVVDNTVAWSVTAKHGDTEFPAEVRPIVRRDTVRITFAMQALGFDPLARRAHISGTAKGQPATEDPVEQATIVMTDTFDSGKPVALARCPGTAGRTGHHGH